MRSCLVSPSTSRVTIYGPTKARFYDFPLLTGNETDHVGYVGAFQSPWPGTVAFYRSPEDSNYTLNQTVTAPAKMGNLLNSLYAGPVGRWDYGNKIIVQMDIGNLSSASKLAVLGGENLIAIAHDNGIWEVIQFEMAVLIAPGQYELQGLLRALGGTDDAMEEHASIGADFVIIDEALSPINMNLNEIGLEHFWRYGPGPYIIGHPAFQTEQITFNSRALRPLNPVHVKGQQQGGDLQISWIRRARIGADSWELKEILLAEDQELYEVDILGNGTPIRTLSSSISSLIYSAADQISDWGSAQPSYNIKVYQISQIYGRGTYKEAVITNN